MVIRDAIIINRPVTEVWAFLQQPNSEAAWHPGFIEEKITSPGGLGLGATGIEVRRVFGRCMEVRAPAEHSVQLTSGTLRVL
jgi:hypothetical protein